MNFRRGLLRLWIVASFFWLAIIGATSWQDVAKDRWWTGDPWWEDDPLADLPVRCEHARGTLNVDYKIEDAVEPWNRYRNPSQACWYSEQRFRVLWPEYADIKRFDLSRKLYRTLGWSPAFDGDRFERTKTVAIFAFAPPLILLVLGSLILWALAGFRSAEKRP